MSVKDRLECGQQRLGNDQSLGAAVTQHEIVLAAGKRGVDGDRYNAGFDRAEKHRRKIDRVGQAQQDTRFQRQAKTGQGIGAAIHPPRQLGIGVGSIVIDVSDLLWPDGEIAFDQIDCGIVGLERA